MTRPVSLAVVLAVALSLTPGCTGFSVDVPDGSGGGGGGTMGSGTGDSFDDPITATRDADGNASFSGTVSERGDIDVYDLGAFEAGTQIRIDTVSMNSNLDPSSALFDAQGRLVYENDDANGIGGTLDSRLDLVLRRSSDNFYLVVTNSAFAVSGTFTGAYAVTVAATPGQEVPAPVPQTLLLDFDGAEVNSPVLGTFTLEPFDGADISSLYRGETEALKASIVAVVRENFEGFAVDVITSDDELPEDMSTVTSIFFGGFNAGAFGLAEQVDLYNVDKCDDAIIYTETFVPHQFSADPSAELLGVAIGNVAAHEAGHVLGLNHVQDDAAIMDDVSPSDALLLDQEFKEAPLSPDIVQIGTQDAPLLLSESVGRTAP